MKSILLRKGIRSDTFLTTRLLFREPLRRIPFWLDTYALMKSQYWPREKLRQLSEERFAETVRHAATIPFWKERFANVGINPHTFSERDIARIPLLSKKDFADKDVADYIVPELLSKSRKYHTSGSTGRPLNLFHDLAFELRSSAISERMFRAAGDGKRFPVVLMIGFSNFGFDYAPHKFFFLRGYNSVYHRARELEKYLSKFPKGVILFGLGSSLLELARTCRKLDITLPLRGVISTGEELRENQRQEIEEVFATRIRITYGMTEIRRLAFECEYDRLHLNEECSYFEITDDKGAPLPLGSKGRIVVTGFENRVMPFIRYDTGDIGSMSTDLCPCGRTLRTIEFQGRQVQLLDIGDGRTTSVIDFFFIFDAHYNIIRQFQIVRTDRRAFTMRVFPRGRTIDESIKNVLTEQFKLRIHPNIHINWEIVDSIPEGPNGKAQYFIDEFEKKI